MPGPADVWRALEHDEVVDPSCFSAIAMPSPENPAPTITILGCAVDSLRSPPVCLTL